MLFFRLTHRFPFYAALVCALLLGACSTAPVSPPYGTAQPSSEQQGSTSPETQPGSNSRKGGGYYLDDGPAAVTPQNLASVPNAVPRVEPLRAASNRPYSALDQRFVPLQTLQPFSQTGMGSWYGKKFHGAKTSSGERYNMFAMTAAHPTLPIPSYARVTNLSNGRSVIVRVNDRGPFLHGRIIDLSYVAAWKLGYVDQGSARLRVEALVPDALGRFDTGNTTTIATAGKPAQPEAPTAQMAEAGTPPAIDPKSTTDEKEDSSPQEEAVDPAALLAGTQPTPPSPESGIFLQVGSFTSAQNADSFRDYLEAQLSWLRQEIHTEYVGDRYRLQLGPFDSTDEARNVSARIASSIRIQSFLVQR